ncbi:c-type cytochrome [Aureliella helgolandensis]|uniref:Di-heme cytochrome c peroxidase n=1 Tax=Aureliella helgolandensis TaxID=2527968 RepID=A0A518G923_9BACT|nr:c-type cytochrome [Aureliella helgolandensis]QDV25097.1 Di-heme cytochrome c peroxidase [Aureliella helgolandensis]
MAKWRNRAEYFAMILCAASGSNIHLSGNAVAMIQPLTRPYPSVWAGLLLGVLAVATSSDQRSLAADLPSRTAGDLPAVFRGPVDLVLLERETLAVTANELSNSVTLVELASGSVLDELSIAKRPAAIAPLSERSFVVSCRDSGTLEFISLDNGRLQHDQTLHVGWLPMGLAVDLAHQRLFVGLMATGEAAEIRLTPQRDASLSSTSRSESGDAELAAATSSEATLVRRFPVGRWPRFMDVSPDGSRLVVGLSGDSQLAVIDTETGSVLYEEPIVGGINIGHVRCSADGTRAYFPWMIYRTNPIDVRNIQLGWVLASRLARIRLDGPAYREAISLDVPRRAMADPHGLALTPDEKRIVVTSSGTHELLVYRHHDLPFVGAGGPGDLIDPELMRDQDLFYRIELGGRPLGVQSAPDNRRMFVANQTLDCIQIVDIESKQVERTIALGPTPQEENQLLVHRGMEIFHDAAYSLDQWYSCASCHLDGGSNAKAMDTWNDGTELTTKTVLPLFSVSQTGPWTWHGWQEDLEESIQNSFVSTMQGEAVSDQELLALQAYLASCNYPPNPFLLEGKQLSDAASRGKLLFESEDVGCANCHSGNLFTDGEIHDVGLNSASDAYEGYNTPSLVGVYQKVRLLHDGRAKSLSDVLTKWHRPDEIGGGMVLSDEQREDLIAYLKSL